MAETRDISIGTAWAKDALTVIPSPPVSGVPYRNPAASDFGDGQRYDRVFDSARWNQFLYALSKVGLSTEQFAGLPWSPLTAYPTEGRALGTDGQIYRATQPSDAQNPRDPVTENDYWRKDEVAPLATTTVAGISREATTAEAESGVSTTPAALPHVTPEGLAAAVSATRWKSRAIGEPFAVWGHLTGAEIPPTATDGPRFVKLTAGDTYNTGLLSGETVTGTAPNITATAVIALETSPLHGQTVHLLNTERRFLRPGDSGAVADDAVRSHDHPGTAGYGTAGVSPYGKITTTTRPSIVVATLASNYAGYTGTAGDTETRPRNIGATYYMRIA